MADKLIDEGITLVKKPEDDDSAAKSSYNWIKNVRKQDHNLGKSDAEQNEDGQLFRNDGIQESPSRHKWNFDLEGGKNYEVPKQLDVGMYNY